MQTTSKRAGATPHPPFGLKLCFLIVFIAATAFAGCDFIEDLYHPGARDEDGGGSSNPDVSGGPGAYAAGSESNGGISVAKVWKNGVATSLTDGTNRAFAFAMYVSGSDVYAAGYETTGSTRVAKVWRNGVATSLTDGTNYAEALAMYVSGSGVYAAGYERNGSREVAKVWKNGAATSLTDGTNNAQVNSLFVVE
jgi:hypothetical protein